MNLIEILLQYRNQVRAVGREAADKGLRKFGFEETLFQEIRKCVSQGGNFVGMDGSLLQLGDLPYAP